MNTTITVQPPAAVATVKRLTLATVVALAVIGFVLVAMETMPAGLLPLIASGMWTSECSVGLFVSAYALGTVIAGALIAAIARDADGQPGGSRLPLVRVFRIPGIAVILAVIFTWMLAHNTICTDLSPYLRSTSGSLTVDIQIFIFGLASIGGIGITGALLDRHPRPLLHVSAALFIIAGIVLLVGHTSTAAIVVATVLWGVAFGGVSAQVQAALTTTGGDDSDIANSFLPVAFNLAIFTAGVLGAALLTTFDGLILTIVMIVFGLAALLLTLYGRRTAFTSRV